VADFDPIKRKTYEDNVRFLAQQRFSKLRPYVNDKPENTAKHSFRVVSPRNTAKNAMNAKAAGRQDTVYNATMFANRVAIPAVRDTADSYEWEDVVRMSTDPNSTLTLQQAAQCGREIDDVILTSMFANALDENAAVNAFPAGQIVGGAAQVFNVALIRNLNKKFKKNEVDPDEEKIWVISPEIEEKILAMPEAINSDFVSSRKVESGDITTAKWFGFTWVISNRLEIPAGTQRYLPVFTRRAMGMVVNKDLFSKIAEEPGKRFSTTVYTAFDAGAVRVQDEQIFKVHVDEAL
jgi:hypothetical protein